jgi:hypothetical protein
MSKCASEIFCGRSTRTLGSILDPTTIPFIRQHWGLYTRTRTTTILVLPIVCIYMQWMKDLAVLLIAILINNNNNNNNMMERLPNLFIPIVVILAISLSMHKKSYDAITGTAQQYIDVFAPTRLEAGFSLGSAKKDPSMEPNWIDRPLNVVVMYADDMRHNSIGEYSAEQ